MNKTILVLGGGTGGIILARELSWRVGNDGEVNPVKIIIFEKEEKNVFAPDLLWLMVGKRKPKQVYRQTNKIAGEGVEIVLGEIEKVNPETISITVKNKEYKGDYMVISMGAATGTEHHLNAYGQDFYTLAGATKFYELLNNFKGGKIAVTIPSLPFKCPAAPYEAAMLIEDFIRKKGLDQQSEISLYSPEPGPMPVAGQELSKAVSQMVAGKGIKYFPEHQLTSATENTLTFSNGKTVEYDLLAYTPKHQCPAVIKETDLVGKSGWVEVDKNTMETKYPNVYAIGDITSIPLDMGKPLPKAGVFAHYQAEVVARNIARRIAGRVPDASFNGAGQCFLEMGGGKAGYAGGNFYHMPLPLVQLKRPGYWWHWTKVIFEKYWFLKYF